MALDSALTTVVRLTVPYPNLSTLGGGSEVCLRVEAAADSPQLAQTLAEIDPDRVVRAPDGSIVIEGQLDRLLAGLRGLPSNLGSGLPARALREALEHLSRPAPALKLGDAVWEFGQRTYLLGVVNVTPDSFSGDGVGGSPEAALARAQQLVEEGADGLDIGGESTRPGHQQITAEEEVRRVVPALELVAGALSVPIFVDTSKAAVARAALAAGADGVNDIWGLRRDPGMAGVVAASQAPVVCMHNQASTDYEDLLGEVLAQLRESLQLAERAGIPRSQVVLDPGIGFGKNPAQNYEVLRRLVELRALGCPILVGPSRKSLIGWVLDQRPVAGRLLGTAATVAWSIACGADIVRVHDVAQIRDVARVLDVLARHPPA
ncbi:MAG TPA: dihydropteroate synthase [Candidatus Dormibacteraeota bacterium]|nr:dihydropteroate synthase [Candidatus Dormibacteraeota bacterium]